MEANSFPIEVKLRRAYLFVVDICSVNETRAIPLNKARSSPADKEHCRVLFELANRKTKGWGTGEKKYIYDGSACLYHLHDFKDSEFILQPADLPEDIRYRHRNEIRIRVFQPMSNHELPLDIPIDSMTVDQLSEYKKFISLAISQDSIDRGVFSVINYGHLFVASNEQAEPIRNCVELRRGFKKSIRIVQRDEKFVPSIEIDVTTSAFYRPIFLSEAQVEFRTAIDANNMLLGVTVEPEYNRERRLIFTNFSEKNPEQYNFVLKDGTSMSVLDYFAEKKKLYVHPTLKLACVKPIQAGVFPSELLRIVPHQRVRCERLDSRLTEQVHARNAVLPKVRYDLINEIVQHLNLTADNPVLKAFQITVAPHLFRIDDPLPITLPKVMFGGNRLSHPKPDGNFNSPSAKYYHPGKITNWAVLYGDVGDARDVNTVKEFVKRLLPAAVRRGMELPAPQFVEYCDLTQWMPHGFKAVANLNGLQMLMVIDPKAGMAPTHAMLKLAEPKYKIVVQHFDYAKVKDVVMRNQGMVLDNMLNKINMKIGGCNYAPVFSGDALPLSLGAGTFVVGYTAAAGFATEKKAKAKAGEDGTPIITEPLAVGFAGNYVRNPNLIVGSYLYQLTPDNQHELVDPTLLENQFHHMLDILGKQRPKDAKPPRIVILRDGLSENAFSKVVDHELPAIRKACLRIDPKYAPQLAVLVTTKDTTTRVFNVINSPRIDNPQPGTVIETGIVRDVSEFVMIPHKAIKGTAQPMKATVIHNEIDDINMHVLEQFIHTLSYSHQLTCAPTSLPEPVYQASILAKRALYILPAFREFFKDKVPRLEDGTYDVERLNRILSPRNSLLELVRYTA
uniref:Piwi domain-containing protein n=1 Tax=Panagrellus redivivus TaxID=6233 RepID=A0A7E4VR97_PANRE